MAVVNRLVLSFALLALLSPVFGCIYEYGSVKEAQAQAGKHYSYGYNGLDWPTNYEQCSGRKQSPVHLASMGAMAAAMPAPAAKASFRYGTLINPVVTNTGHTLQVSLPAGFKSDVQIPIRGDKKTATATSILNGQGSVTGRVKATPAQFHFHTHSEHVINGAQYPVEMHIVHFVKSDQLPACGSDGCPVVLGFLLQLTPNEAEVKPELRKLFEAMPLNQGEKAEIKDSININSLLPQNLTYWTYEGSLTTPPCSEGILWHVLANPIKISQSLLTRYQEAVGDVICGDAAEQMKEELEGKSGDAATEKTAKAFMMPSASEKGCYKLANGHNYRVTQPLYGRQIQLAVA